MAATTHHATVRSPKIASPISTAAAPVDQDADAHADVGEAVVLRHQRAGERDEAVGERKPDHLGTVGVTPSEEIIGFVLAGGAHREPEICCRRTRPARGSRARAITNAIGDRGEDVVVQAINRRRLAATTLSPNTEGRREQRRVGFAHDPQVDGVERRHRDDAGDDVVDPELGVDQRR